MLAADRPASYVGAVAVSTRADQAALRGLIDRLRGYFLTQQGEPRKASFAGTGFRRRRLRVPRFVEASSRSGRGSGARPRRRPCERFGAT